MNTKSLKFEKDGFDYIIKEKSSKGGAMYRVQANSEDEARKLFNLNSHLVKFVGSFYWL